MCGSPGAVGLDQSVRCRVVQEKHGRKLARERRGQPSFAVPGRAVYRDAIAIRPQHNTLVAQQPDAGLIDPQPGHRRLAGALLAGEQVGPAGCIQESASVDLDTSTLGQQVDHQQLVEWVFERIHRFG